MHSLIPTFAAIALPISLTSLLVAQQGSTGEASATASTIATSPAAATVSRPALLPEAIASFGACTEHGWLYVYGGHIGRAHAHSREHVVGSFRRLNLADGTSWQELPSGPALQGTTLVAGGNGALYRIGGMTAHNAADQDADMHSTASVARFDVQLGRWSEVTPLPEPRSSHDAIVLDDRLYVIGGWTLAGDDEGEWLDTAWVADLRSEPLAWRALPAPQLPRRAIAVAAFGGRIAVLGGMTDEQHTAAVQLFDPANGTWSDGPPLPGMAFGTAALGVGDWLYATVMDGRVLRWNGSGDWQLVQRLATPRLFHRLALTLGDETLLAFGGAARSAHLRTIETVSIAAQATVLAPTLREYVIPAPGDVAYRQALALHDDVLWAFGGNRGHQGERFAATQFADDVWRIDLTTMTATRSKPLPFAAQSLAVAPIGTRGDQLLVGGLGPVGDVVQSLAATLRWHSKPCHTSNLPALPTPRTQSQLVPHAGCVYLVGGIDFTPDDGGGATGADSDELLVCDLAAEQPSFVPSGIRLPRPRRSFGAVVQGTRLLLIGGLGHDFEHAGPCDIYDFATGTWSELAIPREWVSPQVAAVGDRVYVACGGTMRGQRFTADESLWALEADGTWTTVIEQLPFAVRHVQMFANHDRLWFYSANESPRGRIVLRELAPGARP